MPVTDEGGAPEALAELIARHVVALLGDDRQLLDRRQLAARIGISERAVTNLANRGELPAGYQIGGVRRWDWTEVRRHLRSGQAKRRRGRGQYTRGRQKKPPPDSDSPPGH